MRRLLFLITLAVLILMFIPWLGDTLFNTKGEPREAIVAVSMLNSGNYILPLLLAEPSCQGKRLMVCLFKTPPPYIINTWIQ